MERPCQSPSPSTRRHRHHAAQATVEFIGIAPILVLAALMCLQGALLGLTVLYAQAAASEAATDESAATRTRSLAALPAAWRGSASVRSGSGVASVSLRAPKVLPGTPAALRNVRASAGMVEGS